MTRHLLPREVVVDRLMKEVNGLHTADPMREGYLSRDRAIAALDMFKAANSVPLNKDFQPDESLAKNVTQATGLTYYDLRSPALNLFPTVTPLRNAIARNTRPNPGPALNYKVIFATTGSGFPYMGWVPEGQRSASMSYTATPVAVPYVTLGEEDSLTDEAKYAAQGFEDEDALVQLRLLLKMFVKEEAAILGGNASLALGTPTTPTVSAVTVTGVTGTLASATYSVIVVALTQEGFLNSSTATGVATALTITGNDAKVYTLNGGSSNKSANAVAALTLGQTLFATTPVVIGAVAYAWYIGVAGSETLQQITTVNSVAQNTPLTTGQQAATAVTADCSRNQAVAFDGLLTTCFKNYSAGNSYVYSCATGTVTTTSTPANNGSAGAGMGLTPSGKGSVVEIDTLLVTMWNKFRVSPTVIYVNAQELNNITTCVLTSATAPLLRYNTAADQSGMVEYKLTAGGVISFYFNPFTADGGVKIPVKIHPNLAPGTLIAWAEVLPPWYVSNETPVVAEMITRRDYYNEVWPRTSRLQYYGVYCQEALAVYAPFAMGIINNIGSQIN